MFPLYLEQEKVELMQQHREGTHAMLLYVFASPDNDGLALKKMSAWTHTSHRRRVEKGTAVLHKNCTVRHSVSQATVDLYMPELAYRQLHNGKSCS